MKYIVLIAMVFFSLGSYAQKIKGKVVEKINGSEDALVGVNVYWLNTNLGTTTNAKGYYTLERHPKSQKLVFSYIGFRNDTVSVSKNQTTVNVQLRESKQLSEIQVVERKDASTIDRMTANQVQNISGEAFHRAACCNLSESFENNATVDVSYSDAVTGSKQIKMLGLDGKYVQMQIENIPMMSGLASSYGLTYIPGPWMESIQVSKGAASVKNGYESITGQINSEYKKPDKSDRLFLNVVANDALGGEANMTAATKLNNKWSTLVAGHFHNNQTKHDRNKDGFLDQPLVTRYQFFNRWKLKSKDFGLQFGAMYLTEDRLGGQTSYKRNLPSNSENGYGISIKTERAEVFAKGGYIFPNRPDFSVAFISNGAFHNHQSFYGLKTYDAQEKSIYGSLLMEGIIGTANHKFSTGLSYKYNELDETLNGIANHRLESVPGAFFEYTYRYASILTFMAGLRADYHNEFGLFATPRLHTKYNLNEDNIFRLSAGLGYRTPNVLVENTYLLANGVPVVYKNTPEMERAANYGVSYIRYFKFLQRKWTVMLDYYRTDFMNQVIVDREDNTMISIYNLEGQSYSNAAQIELQATPIKRLDVTLAFRYNDVKADYNGSLLETPMVNRYKGLIALSYATNLKKWQFDANFQLNGDGRLPGAMQHGERNYQSYWIVNAQVTKFFRKWSIYLGAENITDFVQNMPILNADQPFSGSFDASQVWGPVHGRKIYLGLRYNIAEK